MIGQIIGAVSGIASTYLEGRQEVAKNKAVVAKAKAEAEAKVMVSAATSTAEWEKIMAQNSGGSWKDEFFSIILAIPLVMSFIPGLEGVVAHGFEQLDKAPDWYHWILLTAISASFGARYGPKLLKGSRK